MAYVSKEQIAAAKQMCAIEFLQKYRPGELVQGGARNEYQLRSHDSFKINGETSLWHWKSRDIGGKSALDYLIHVEGAGFVEAVEILCGEIPAQRPVVPARTEEKPFSLPAPSADNRRVAAYLAGRGIDRKVLAACFRAGILYESAEYHNAVFVGKDETGTARYAFLRGTYPKGKPFKAEVSGSDKRYSFCVPPKGESRRVAVYEGAVDALAHLTLEGRSDKYRLSLGGVYAPKEGEAERNFRTPPALAAFLSRHPEVEELELCLDNDFAGRWAAEHIAGEFSEKYHVAQNLPEREGWDYADLAQEKASRQRAELER